MDMNNEQLKQLHDALLSAFPTLSDLEMMVYYRLNENLPAITRASNLEHAVFELLRWARARGKLRKLVIASLEQNSENPQLRRFAEQLGLRHSEHSSCDLDTSESHLLRVDITINAVPSIPACKPASSLGSLPFFSSQLRHWSSILVPALSLVFLLVGSIAYYPSQQAQSLPIYRNFFTDVVTPNMSQEQGVKWTTSSSCQLLADAFHVINQYEKGSQSCMANNLILNNFDLSIDVKMNHAAYVTIYVRSKTTPGRPIKGGYVRINKSGKYSVQYNMSDVFGPNELIVPWTFPDAKSLKPGEGIWNTVRIRLQGSQLSLWFNPVSSTSQPDFIRKVPQLRDNKGIIGFGATTSALPEYLTLPLDVAFRNLTIYSE